MRNPDLERRTLLDALNALPADCQDVFKLLYGCRGGQYCVEDVMERTLGDIVAGIPDDTLEQAMLQVRRTPTVSVEGEEIKTVSDI